MIGILHGYSLEGSGSNLWTRYMIRALCRQGETVHLICQEKSPEKYDFIGEAYDYSHDGSTDTLFRRDVPYPGHCIFHRPELSEVLPVYVGRFLESDPPMLPMNELQDESIQNYIDRNYRTVHQIVTQQRLRLLHVNHAILMSVVAERIYRKESIPYAVMPHGSEIEYVIRKDARFLDLALQALSQARRIFVISPEIHERVMQIFSAIPELASKTTQLKLGVDTTVFEVISRAERSERIERLCDVLSSIPRGKKPGMTQEMLAQLEETISAERMKELMDTTRQYPGRQPDEDLELKLSRVDWKKDSILLYSGRLISGKGIQLLLAALPSIFELDSSARLLVAGHGPLRECLEAFLWSLQHGKTQLVQKLIQWGSFLEDGDLRPFVHIQKFYENLQKEGKLNHYFEKASSVLSPERIIFTGYLKHEQLRYLYSCSDVAIFPSIVPEAGPLVFLESLASGCFPISTYFAGAAGHIDLVSGYLPSRNAELMKIRVEQEFTIPDIIEHVPAALALNGRYQSTFREIAVQNYDWQHIAQLWKQELYAMVDSSETSK